MGEASFGKPAQGKIDFRSARSVNTQIGIIPPNYSATICQQRLDELSILTARHKLAVSPQQQLPANESLPNHEGPRWARGTLNVVSDTQVALEISENEFMTFEIPSSKVNPTLIKLLSGAVVDIRYTTDTETKTLIITNVRAVNAYFSSSGNMVMLKDIGKKKKL